MPTYQIHTIASAPEKSRPVLEQLQQGFGFIPNLAAAISNSPKLLTAFAAVFQQVHSAWSACSRLMPMGNQPPALNQLRSASHDTVTVYQVERRSSADRLHPLKS